MYCIGFNMMRSNLLNKIVHCIIVFTILSIPNFLSAQIAGIDSLPYISLEKFKDGIHHWDLFSTIRNYDKLDTTDIIGIADNLIAYQNGDGGWPKNIDWLGILNADSVKGTLTERHRESTFDNRNIYTQVEYLSKVFYHTGMDRFKLSALCGIKYILEEQHRSGGWKGSDVDAITFNDDVMAGNMNMLLDIINKEAWYSWLDSDMRRSLKAAYDKALSATLKCQIIVNGEKTAWGQQHDHITYEPVKARSYELPSITAKESTEIVLFLMRIKNPGDSVIDAIESAIAWFEKSKIVGYRYAEIKIPEVKYHETTVDHDRVFIADSTADPVWARYYDLTNSQPFLCRRDGTVVFRLEEIGFERRIGYAWYGYWPEEVLRFYPAWKKSLNIR